MKTEFIQIRIEPTNKKIAVKRAKQMNLTLSKYLIYLIKQDNSVK